MIDSSDKFELGQTKWRTKMRGRLKLFTSFLIQRLRNKAKYRAQQKLPNQLSRSVSDKKYPQNPRGEKHKSNLS